MPRRTARPKRRVKRGQLALSFPNRWGGARAGAGRKPGPRPSTLHRERPAHRASEPVHVTLRSSVAQLRSQHVFPTIKLAIAGANARSPRLFRVIHFSVQRDHVHFIVEAKSAQALSAGVRSLAIRIARYVNELLSRHGPLWDGRWHGRALTTPREVRNALLYVLANFRKHGGRAPRAGIDPYSSGAWFDGWQVWQPVPGAEPPWALRGPAAADEPIVLPPTTWLARRGWRRHGLLALDEAPGPSR